jgi:hypothetical protein
VEDSEEKRGEERRRERERRSIWVYLTCLRMVMLGGHRKTNFPIGTFGGCLRGNNGWFTPNY